MVTMESFGDQVRRTAAESGEVIDERAGQDRGGSVGPASPYGTGVPTAESFADDVPVEWLHAEDGSF
jgi:hypothetical protein